MPNILNEKNINLVIEQIVNDEDSQKSDTEIHTHESIDELKNPQDYGYGGILIADDLNERQMVDTRVQSMLKRSIFIISQDYYELPKKTIRANGNIYHILKANTLRDIQNLRQDKTIMDMTPNLFKYQSSSYLSEKNQPLTIDMTKDRINGRHRLGLNSLFIPDSSRF